MDIEILIQKIEQEIQGYRYKDVSLSTIPDELIDEYIKAVEKKEGKPYTEFVKEDIAKYKYLEIICGIKNEQKMENLSI